MPPVIESLGYLTVQAAVIIFASICIGYILGSIKTRAKHSLEIERLNSTIKAQESKEKHFWRDKELMNKKLERYLYYFLRLPEAVKQINSNLAFEDLQKAIVRTTKELIDTDSIALYLHDSKSDTLRRVASYGPVNEEDSEIKVGSRIVGKAAHSGMIIAKNDIMAARDELSREALEMATPILFKNELIGAIGVGNIKVSHENERRFLAMIAELAGIAFKNCEFITVAKNEAISDSLTGLYNKGYFLDRAREIAKKAKSYDFPLSIFIFDIDNFKNYNDTNGHLQGDELLKELSDLVKKNTRSTNLVARYGGEEFVVLLQDTAKEEALTYAESIRKIVEAYPFQFRERQPLGCVSISGGVAAFPSDGETVYEVIKSADDALYASKSAGRNKITKYEHFPFAN